MKVQPFDGILVIGLSATWQVRIPTRSRRQPVGAIPALRLFAGRAFIEYVVYGIGVNVALLMLVSLGLVTAGSWYSTISIMIPLLASLAAGARPTILSATT